MTTADMNIKKLNNDSIVPTKGSEYAAGLDLYAYIPRGAIDIPAGATVKIGTALYLHEVGLLLNEDCAHLTVWES